MTIDYFSISYKNRNIFISRCKICINKKRKTYKKKKDSPTIRKLRNDRYRNTKKGIKKTEYYKKASKISSNILDDKYVLKCLFSHKKVIQDIINQEIINTKRQQLLLHRQLKTIKL